MIRPAKFSDIMRIVELLEKLHGESKYADMTSFDRKAAQALIQQCVHRHGGQHDGGALVMVAIRDQRIEGFMVGILDRVYHVCEKLAANDVFLYCTSKAHPTSFLKLFRAYTSWATNNPKVAIIKASHTDAVEGGERMGAVYLHDGFEQVGAIYEKVLYTEDVATQALKVLEKAG